MTNGTPSTFGYVELHLGRIYFPTSDALGGLALEVWSRVEGAAANLDLDDLWLVSNDGRGTVIVPGGVERDMAGFSVGQSASSYHRGPLMDRRNGRG